MFKKTNNEIKHTAHSSYRCQYHIVFAPKFRRKEIYGQLQKDIGEIIRKLCEQKGVEIIEAEACPDHIHMLVSIVTKEGFLSPSINSSLTRRIFEYRYIKGDYKLSWQRIAVIIGGGNTADGVRKTHKRYIEKHDWACEVFSVN